MSRAAAVALVALLSLALLPARAAAPAGEVLLVAGAGSAVNGSGQVRDLVKGNAVYAGDLLVSGPDSYINVKFVDGAFVLLRPETRFRIEEFRYVAQDNAPAPAPRTPGVQQPVQGKGSSALLHLLKGGLRAVSGSIGKHADDDYKLITPIVTIGIRGTDYFAVLCDATCATDPVIGAALPPGTPAGEGLVTGVLEGAIDVSPLAQNQPQALSAGEFLFTGSDGAQWRLPAVPRFLLIDPMPNPRTCTR